MIVIKLNKTNPLPSEYYYFEGVLFGIEPVVGAFAVRFLPRKFVTQCILNLRNEITNETQEYLVDMENKGGLAELTFNASIEDATTYEMLVTDLEENELFRGRAFATIQNNLQEYTMNTKINNKIVL